jgi:hypothetical protein
VEPAAIDVTGMAEGDERNVPIRVRSPVGTPAGLYPIRVEPAGGAVAAATDWTVSVGVVLTIDRRLPLLAQSLVRAPGYTIRVDHRSGVAYYLLDADGHRRHGHLGDSGSSSTGFFAVARADRGDEYTGDAHGRWAFNYRLPCRFVFEGKNGGADSLILVSGGQRSQVRLRYTFHEDRIVVTLIQPTDPTAAYELWMGEFDTLGEPRFNNASGTQQRGKERAVVADAVFFPHPYHRQGLRVTLPDKQPICARDTGLHFPVRVGQDVAVQFAAEGELPEGFKGVPKGGKPAKTPGEATKGKQ